MSYLSKYMAQDEVTQNLLSTLPADEHLTVTVNGEVVDLSTFIETHCTHVIEEASIKFASGLILGYGPKHHNRGWVWGVALLPARKIDYSYIHELTDVLHTFVAKVKALRDFVRWVEVNETNLASHMVDVPLEHRRDAFMIDKDHI